jgi:hypothetical protein
MKRSGLKYLGLGAGAAAVVALLVGLSVPDVALGAADMAQMRGALTFTCYDTGMTCDQANYGVVCNITVPEGDYCLNCSEEAATDLNCVQDPADNCVDDEEETDCGFTRLGRCHGFTCDGSIQVLGDTCDVTLDLCHNGP